MALAQIWTPPNIAPICAETNANLTQCNNMGYMYLSLIAQLFGSSRDLKSKSGRRLSSHEDNVAYGHQLLDQNRKLGPDNKYYRQNYTLVPTKGSKKTPQKKTNKNKSSNYGDNEYDFIIVGAGSGGCVVANRLTENKNWRVLLLEAGPEEVELSSVPGLATALPSSNVDWAYRTQPEKQCCRALRYQGCVWFRGRQMGGTSTMNYMIYMRGNKRDYDGWAELGNDGWSYKEVLPYFKKSENNRNIEAKDTYYHATGGLLNVERFPFTEENALMIVNGLHELGLPITDFNGANQIGTNIAQSMSLNAFVTKVLIDPKTKTAYGVEYIKDRKVHNAFARKEVIVSSGTLNSPKLLMLSGVGPKQHLKSFNIPVLADLAVGYNLQDQVSTDGIIISLSNKTSTWLDSKGLQNAIKDYYKQPAKKNGPLSSVGNLVATGFMKSKFATEDAPDLQFYFEGHKVKDYYADIKNYLATLVWPLSFFDSFTPMPMLLTPKSRGVVKLNTTDPIFGMPMIYSGFFTKDGDMDIILEGIRFLLDLEKTEIFKRNGAKFVREPLGVCKSYNWGTDEYFKCLLVNYTSALSHPVGTCKMGPKSDKSAVVDPRLRVYGINHLRVIDCSIFPVGARGNTNAQVTMVAEKGSDMIKEDWLGASS